MPAVSDDVSFRAAVSRAGKRAEGRKPCWFRQAWSSRGMVFV